MMNVDLDIEALGRNFILVPFSKATMTIGVRL